MAPLKKRNKKKDRKLKKSITWRDWAGIISRDWPRVFFTYTSSVPEKKKGKI
jgi:hypothetical protein